MEAENTKKRRKLGKVLLILLILVCLIGGSWFVLFKWNQFSLVIGLRGNANDTAQQGEYYEDPGADVRLQGSLFFKDGITLDIQPQSSGHVDIANPGKYRILYSASFLWWDASENRMVQVLDSVPPSITLVSNPGYYTVHGEEYVEEGFSAWDSADGDLTDQVVREEKDGFVIYSVVDQSGNRTTVSRKILYVDLTAPEIVLVGEEPFRMTAGESFTDPGWAVMDNVDGDLSEWVEVSGFVDKYLAGNYQLTYTVRDGSGNCAEAYRTVTVEPKGLPDTVRPEGKIIYLTFDDGPGPYTDDLLRILDMYDAKATFFVVNTEYIHFAKDIVEGGHAIGIHCVEHDYKALYESADAYFNDLLAMQQIIYDQTGVKTYLMRFPGGSSNTVSRFNPGIMTYLTQAVEDCGFQYFDWNVDSMDAGGAKDWEDVYENVTEGAKNRRISVVLQHDIKGFSVDAVERILIWGKANGYKFLALDMTSPTSHHGVNN